MTVKLEFPSGALRWGWLVPLAWSAWMCLPLDPRGWMPPLMLLGLGILLTISQPNEGWKLFPLWVFAGLLGILYSVSLGNLILWIPPSRIHAEPIDPVFAVIGVALLIHPRVRIAGFIVLLVGLVVYFSGSAGGSDPMRQLIERIGVPEGMVDGVLYTVRKGIHFTFYALLATAAWHHVEPGPRCRAYALAIALVVATFDEGRQFGLANRTGQLLDVLIDMLGAGFAIWLCERASKPNEFSNQQPV